MAYSPLIQQAHTLGLLRLSNFGFGALQCSRGLRTRPSVWASGKPLRLSRRLGIACDGQRGRRPLKQSAQVPRVGGVLHGQQARADDFLTDCASFYGVSVTSQPSTTRFLPIVHSQAAPSWYRSLRPTRPAAIGAHMSSFRPWGRPANCST